MWLSEHLYSPWTLRANERIVSTFDVLKLQDYCIKLIFFCYCYILLYLLNVKFTFLEKILLSETSETLLNVLGSSDYVKECELVPLVYGQNVVCTHKTITSRLKISIGTPVVCLLV